LRMNMMISYQELVRTFPSSKAIETLPDCICVLRSLELIVGKRTSASNPPGATNVHDLSIKFPVK
ncbi:hypothetical protein, partial [Escherichia coli]|uniref:hypothetical protein n=1 Tax=Escherichia coli TaxID=562 RepID=UPI0031B63D23